MSEKALTLIIHGTPISPGLAQGIIHVHRSLLGRPSRKYVLPDILDLFQG